MVKNIVLMHSYLNAIEELDKSKIWVLNYWRIMNFGTF